MNTIIYTALILLTSPLVGFILFKLTKDEKKLTNYYFPAILWILAVVSAIFYTTNIKYAIITTYMFIAIITWHYLNKQK